MNIIEELPQTGLEESLPNPKDIKFILYFQTDEMDMIYKMIFVDEIEYTPSIKKFLEGELEGNYLLAKQMFEKRELNNHLNKEVKNNNKLEKKSKI